MQTVQALAAEKIRDILNHELPEIDTFLTTVLDVKLTKAQAERALTDEYAFNNCSTSLFIKKYWYGFIVCSMILKSFLLTKVHTL